MVMIVAMTVVCGGSCDSSGSGSSRGSGGSGSGSGGHALADAAADGQDERSTS